jgi:hypothetical protein
MYYRYENERAKVFTDDGQRMFLQIRDHVRECLRKSGAITMGCAMSGARSGDSWTMLACVDRMVELGDLHEIARPGCACQDRIFVPAHG